MDMRVKELNSSINLSVKNGDEQAFIKLLRDFHQDGIDQIKTTFIENPKAKQLFKQHTKLIDTILMFAWEHCEIDINASLIAVGGYGRGELYPSSDLDLLILLPETNEINQLDQRQVESFIGLLWDLGLNIGHSVRTVKECITQASLDITIQTNLMECRLVIGNKDIYHTYLDAISESINIDQFFAKKIQEQDNRYAKYNDTAYNLEPNIKESPGGLRDLHTIMWLTRALMIKSEIKDNDEQSHSLGFKQGYTHLWAWLISENIISKLELSKVQSHERNLQLLRIYLHFESNRREDRLIFDYQNAIASTLGYETKDGKRASEKLMKSYYLSVKFIQVINEILIKSLVQRISNNPPIVKSINEHFDIINNFLETKSASLLQKNPSAIFDVFLLTQQYPEIKGISVNLLRNLQRVKKLVNRDFRQSAQNKNKFIEILSQPAGVNHALRAMNRYGILGSYIPIFGKIVGQMQHDLFHIYTVDEHILNVLANLRRYAKPELAHEFPLCTALFSAFDKPHLLYLAALFHDIAKGRNGDHSALGKVDALHFCKLHGLPKEDGELVAWLVSAHLIMSSTAQKSDLSDPQVISTFAQYVKNERRLVALYLLTVADIRGTSPKVWNAWKARLLESLFNYTKAALENDVESTTQAIATRKKDASLKLSTIGLKATSYEVLWDKFGEHYFMRYETDEISWHSRLLTPHLHASKPIVRARLSPNGDGIQVMIYMKLQNDLFARICNFFDRMSYCIGEAKIYTTDHGYALNTFIILDNSGKAVSYNGLLQFIEIELAKKLDMNTKLEKPLQGRMSRQIKHVPFESKINIVEVADDIHQLDISASDKPGLLAKIARTLMEHEIDIYNAKINTMGDRAEDTFLISGQKHQKLSNARIKLLKEAIQVDL
jgi:[protein-PII] uridylyltransferase